MAAVTSVLKFKMPSTARKPTLKIKSSGGAPNNG